MENPNNETWDNNQYVKHLGKKKQKQLNVTLRKWKNQAQWATTTHYKKGEHKETA